MIFTTLYMKKLLLINYDWPRAVQFKTSVTPVEIAHHNSGL